MGVDKGQTYKKSTAPTEHIDRFITKFNNESTEATVEVPMISINVPNNKTTVTGKTAIDESTDKTHDVTTKANVATAGPTDKAHDVAAVLPNSEATKTIVAMTAVPTDKSNNNAIAATVGHVNVLFSSTELANVGTAATTNKSHDVTIEVPYNVSTGTNDSASINKANDVSTITDNVTTAGSTDKINVPPYKINHEVTNKANKSGNSEHHENEQERKSESDSEYVSESDDVEDNTSLEDLQSFITPESREEEDVEENAEFVENEEDAIGDEKNVLPVKHIISLPLEENDHGFVLCDETDNLDPENHGTYTIINYSNVIGINHSYRLIILSVPSQDAIEKLIAGSKRLGTKTCEKSMPKPTKNMHDYKQYQLSVRSTSMMLLSLFVVTEKKEFLSMNRNHIFKSKSCDYASIIFSLQANHHTVSWNGMTAEFINQGYNKQNGFNMHGVEVFFHEIVDKDEAKGREVRKMQSTYPVSYIGAKNGKAGVPETFYHKTKFAAPLQPSYCSKRFDSSYNDTVLFIKTLVDTIHESGPYTSLEDLETLANIFGFKNLQSTGDTFFSVFQKIKYLFQWHYRLAISIVDGQHRLCMCVKAYHEEALSMHFNTLRLVNDISAPTLCLENNSFISKLQACMVFAMYQFPKISTLRQKSLALFRQQKLMFSRTIGNILQECIEKCDKLLDVGPMILLGDVESLWYSHQYKTNKIKKRDGDELLEEFEQWRVNQLPEDYDPFLARNQYFLPQLVSIMATTDTLFDVKYSKYTLDEIRVNVFAICQVYRNFLAPSEIKSKKLGGNFRIPFNMRILFHILQSMMLTRKRRDLLYSFSLKYFDTYISWPKKTSYALSMDKSFHSIEFLTDLVQCHIEISRTAVNFLRNLAKVFNIGDLKNKFTANKIEAMIKGSFMEQLILDIMRINENPTFSLEDIKEQLSKQAFKQHFEDMNQKGFVRCCLSFYRAHIALMLNTQFDCARLNADEYFGKTFLEKLDSSRSGMFRELKPEVFLLQDFQIPEFGCEIRSIPAYLLDNGVTIPGSFFDFCHKLSTRAGPLRYARFNFIQDVDPESEPDSKSPKKGKENTIEDQYSNLEDDICSFFSSQKHKYKSNPLEIQMFIEQSFSVIKKKAAHNKDLGKMLDKISVEIKKSLPNETIPIKDSDSIVSRLKS